MFTIVTLLGLLKYDYYIFCGCLSCANTPISAKILDIIKLKPGSYAWFVLVSSLD